ncbi:hypothetical protein, conserved [Entamoeba dispar SAW760]|uniref:Pre-rRNA-processing protein TSR2 n=1 Tax=Entamoeba dispar (strain ATCC PRA-260 / SAW760) TaxID=370354 RepID=B0ESH5_ENTDS|nr:uncharacterized protein EDI_275990 [Entamoeba dispar SAW760]EDR22517.1 hypothetical protein, conserved [Entamoeba dispar SAW760]|eukprot:EDR22517.1 hypothetical protein, conserved [Entamoeba dispar SAW760]
MQPWNGRENEFKLFEQSVRGLMNCWSTLRLCVEHQFGGVNSQQKKDSMVQSIISKYRTKGNTINPHSIIDFLYNFFEQKMNTSCEDESIEDVAELISRLCAECIVGDTTLAQNIIEEAKKPLDSAGFQQFLNEDEEYEEDDESDDNKKEVSDDESGEYDPNAGEYDDEDSEEEEGDTDGSEEENNEEVSGEENESSVKEEEV